MIPLILLSFTMSSLSEDTGWQMIVHYWLEQITDNPYKVTAYRNLVSPNDPNTVLYVGTRKVDKRTETLNYLTWFLSFAKQYPGDPNAIKSAPPEPNYPPAVPEVVDPNLLEFVNGENL